MINPQTTIYDPNTPGTPFPTEIFLLLLFLNVILIIITPLIGWLDKIKFRRIALKNRSKLSFGFQYNNSILLMKQKPVKKSDFIILFIWYLTFFGFALLSWTLPSISYLFFTDLLLFIVLVAFMLIGRYDMKKLYKELNKGLEIEKKRKPDFIQNR